MEVMITHVKRISVTKKYNVTEKQLDQLKHGENPFFDEFEKDIESGNVLYDYVVLNEDDQEIVPLSL